MKVLVEITINELGSDNELKKLRFVPKPECTIGDILMAEHALNKMAEPFTVFSVELVRAKEV